MISAFVHRPVFTIVLSLILLLFGLVAVQQLSVRETPQVQAPLVTVRTTWVGADPALVESDVTEVLERQINGIDGIRTLSSQSNEQQSTITVEFTLDRDLEEAANDVRSRASLARRDLPEDVEEPIIEKADADAQPVVFLRLDAPNKNLIELSDIADTLIRERIQSVAGVSSVQIYGEQVASIRIELDPVRLASRRLTVADVATALSNNNVSQPAGRIEGTNTDLSLQLDGDLRTLEEFANMVILERDGKLIRISDVGTVRLGAENERQAARSDSAPSITVAVLPQADANIIDISDAINARLPSIQADLPAGVVVTNGYDRSLSVRSSIEEVEETLAVAFGLVVLVIFAFLRDWRSTLVPTLAIPVSLIGTFGFLWMAGFSINVFTLFGLVLAIGLVVDDAIVVLENVYRHIEEGEDPYTAAINGTNEIAFAVIATTLALVAVFVPVIFSGGTSGRLFLEFGSTVAVSVMISAFVALTLTPMACARLLKPQHSQSAFFRITGKMLDGLTNAFGSTLKIGMRFPVLPIAVSLITIGLGFLAFRATPREFFPLEDRNLLLIRTLAPEGTSFDYMDARMKELEPALMEAVPERKSILSRVGQGNGGALAAGNTGTFVVPLVPKEERDRTQAEILGSVKEALSGVTAFITIPIQPATVGSGFGSPVQFVLQHPDFNTLSAELPGFVKRMSEIPGLTAINPDLKLNKPELAVAVDRDRAAALGVPIRDVGRALQVLAGGTELTQFKRGTRQYPVIVSLPKTLRDKPADLNTVYVRSANGTMIPLSALITTKERSAAASRYHYARSPSATISANLDGITLGQALEQVQAMADDTLPEGFRTALAGESKEFADSSQALALVLVLSLVLVYLILAAQFDSFADPFAILVGVPIALSGAFVSLWILGTTLSFFSQVGLILLVGLVTKNGILIVEVARQMREHDPSLTTWQAAEQAAKLRFRPILMTSVATIGGAVPIALGFTSASRAPLGVVVVGGMMVATVLSLYATPVAWAIVARIAGARPTVATVAKVAPLALALLAARTAHGQDLTLADAFQTAIENNPDLVGLRSELIAADQLRATARAAYLPSVAGTVDANHGIDGRFGSASSEPVDTFTATLRGTVPLLRLSTISATKAASRRYTAAEAAADVSIDAVLADVATRFIAVQRATAAVAVAEADVARSERLSAFTTSRKDADLATELDASRAEFQLVQDQQNLLVARTDLKTARIRLAEGLGTPFTSPPTAIARTPLLAIESLPSEPPLDAIEGHPRVLAASATVDATIAEHQAAKLGWVPTVDAYGQLGVNARSTLDAPLPTALVGVTASLPVFTGLARDAASQRTEALVSAAGSDLDFAKRAVEADVRAAHAQLIDRSAALPLAERAVTLSKREVALAEDRFTTGVSDNLAVIDAQARLAAAERAQVDAEAAFDLAVVAYERAQGRVRLLAASGW